MTSRSSLVSGKLLMSGAVLDASLDVSQKLLMSRSLEDVDDILLILQSLFWV